MATMNKLKRLWILLISSLILTSCDAYLQMSYIIKNTSSNDIKLFVPNYPVDSLPRAFGHQKDTTLILKPNEAIIVGFGIDIDFPWATKNIYRDKPGICGIKMHIKDSIIVLGCTEKEWKYRKGRSRLELK